MKPSLSDNNDLAEFALLLDNKDLDEFVRFPDKVLIIDICDGVLVVVPSSSLLDVEVSEESTQNRL